MDVACTIRDRYRQPLGVLFQDRMDVFLELRPPLQSPLGKRNPNDRMAFSPIPMVGKIKPRARSRLRIGPQPLGARSTLDQQTISGKSFGHGIEEKRLAEAAWTRKKISTSAFCKSGNERGLIHVVVPFVADLRKAQPQRAT